VISSELNKPTGAFTLTLIGGSMSMIGLAYPVIALYRAFPDTISVGLIIVILSMLLHEMPERNITFGAAIAALSTAQLISSMIVTVVTGGLYTGYYSTIPYVLVAGSIISLLGGVAAILWKPKGPN